MGQTFGVAVSTLRPALPDGIDWLAHSLAVLQIRRAIREVVLSLSRQILRSLTGLSPTAVTFEGRGEDEEWSQPVTRRRQATEQT